MHPTRLSFRAASPSTNELSDVASLHAHTAPVDLQQRLQDLRIPVSAGEHLPQPGTQEHADVQAFANFWESHSSNEVESLLTEGTDAAAFKGALTLLKLDPSSDLHSLCKPRGASNESCVHLIARFGSDQVSDPYRQQGMHISLQERFGLLKDAGFSFEASSTAPSALFAAVQSGNGETIAPLIASGAQLETAQPQYARDAELQLRFLMLSAAQVNGPEAMRALSDQGADPNAIVVGKSKANRWVESSPLHEAAKRGHVSAVNALIEMGVDKELSVGPGITAVHQAAQSARPEVIQALAARGFELNAPDHVGDTPLHYAARAVASAA